MHFLRWAGPLVAPSMFLGLPAVYLAVVWLLVRFMRARAPYSLAGPMKLYNIVQIGVCSFMCWGLFPTLWNAPPLDVFVLGVRVPNIFALDAPFTAQAELFVFVHYLSKTLDFCDTVFIVLRRKDAQLTFLHVYHHATIISIWGFLLHMGYGGGTVSFGAWLNSFVHVLMYTHYFVSTFNISNPFKHLLTQIQIAQFYLCVTQALLVAFTNLDSHFPPALSMLQVGYHVSMVLLFSNFLMRSRKSKHGSGGSDGGEQQPHKAGVANGARIQSGGEDKKGS